MRRAEVAARANQGLQRMIQANPRRSFGTLLGFVAIALWATTIAVSRHLTEQLGTLPAAAWMYLASGVLGCTYAFGYRGQAKAFFSLPRAYRLICGAVFVAYGVAFYLAIGFAVDRQQTIEVGLINYLWPSLTLVFCLPILKHKARLTLPLGILVAFGGVVLAMLQDQALSHAFWQQWFARVSTHWLVYGLALSAAVLWALYSNLVRRLAKGVDGPAVPVFLLATGVVLMAACCAAADPWPTWSVRVVAELLYMAVGPGLLAYVCWDSAMRHGEMVLVASASYAIPLFSTLISCVYLRVPMSPTLWLACLLVIVGAVICKFSIVERS